MNQARDYWKECIAVAADECELTLTEEQLTYLAISAESGHEHYGMAFHSPSSGDHLRGVERQWQQKLDEKQRELDIYQSNAEQAIKQALRVHSNASISVGEYGEVLQHGGRTERIQ